MNVAAITIGNRDIKIDGEYYNKINRDDFPDFNKEITVRHFGKYLNQNFSKYKDRISMPIIKPFLEHLKELDKKIDSFILIATNQNDERHRNQDTLFFAKIIKKKIKAKYENVKVKQIEITENVNNYYNNYMFFYQQFNSESCKKMQIDKFLVLPVGGMPNINSPLLLNAILHLKNKVEQYCVAEDGSVTFIPFNKVFIKELEKISIKEALNKFLFASIKNISSDGFIQTIADYSYHRISFNFSDAFKIIEKGLNNEMSNNQIDLLLNLQDSLNKVKDNQKEMIKELFFSARIKIIQEQYVDALVRLYNFADNLSLSIIAEHFNLDLNTKCFGERWKKVIKDLKDKNPDLVEFENNNRTPDGNPLYFEKSGLVSYRLLIEYFNQKGEFNQVIKILDPLIEISKLRNKSIGAHGFEGVSKKDIDHKLEQFNMDLDALLSNIEKYLNISFEDSVYCKINSIIEKRLNII